MSAGTTFQQMIVILLLMMAGFVCRKAKIVDKDHNECLSRLVLNVFNPAIIFSSMVSGSDGKKQIFVGETFLVAAFLFALTIVIGILVSRFMDHELTEQKIYQLMIVFSNMGFVGIPVVKALFGAEYLIYVAIFIFEYNVLIYTYGYALLKDKEAKREKFRVKDLKPLFNMGTVSCGLALLVFVSGVHIPDVFTAAVSYLGDAAVAVSLMVIGISLGEQRNLAGIFKSGKQYLFCAIKLVIIPVIEIVILKRLPVPETICQVCAVLLAMPVGTMPLILVTNKGLNGKKCSDGIILSTILSVITIPLVVSIYPYL